ncbi:MAG: MaoC family dehydratase [Micrococcales bacterium]|nr:MaoC family dehydratase [Micrococcales bacterium]
MTAPDAVDRQVAATPRLADLVVGQEVARGTLRVDRARLVRYANASGDQNPIHQDEAAARAVGLPGVIAHGMWTMGAAVQMVVGWLGDPGRVVSYGTRFTRPVPVPETGEATLTVVVTAAALSPEDGTARLDLDVTFDGAKVLGRAQVVVSLP